MSSLEVSLQSLEGETRAGVSSGVQAQVAGHVQEMTAQLEANRGLELMRARMTFIVDDNEHIWLSHISDFVVEKKSEMSEASQ